MLLLYEVLKMVGMIDAISVYFLRKGFAWLPRKAMKRNVLIRCGFQSISFSFFFY